MVSVVVVACVALADIVVACAVAVVATGVALRQQHERLNARAVQATQCTSSTSD